MSGEVSPYGVIEIENKYGKRFIVNSKMENQYLETIEEVKVVYKAFIDEV